MWKGGLKDGKSYCGSKSERWSRQDNNGGKFRHKRYRELSDFNKKNEFHIEQYLEHKLILPQDQEFELYEYDVSPEEAAAAEKEEDTSVDWSKKQVGKVWKPVYL